MISVLLPTVRPHLVKRSLGSIGPAAGRWPYEVVVVADFKSTVDDPRVRWIQRDRYGVVDAVNVACAEARGDHWFLFNDESTLDPKALQILHDEAVAHPGQLLAPRHEPPFPFAYYGLEFVAFPFAHRSVIQQLGGLLDPAYRGFYADPDLSMRAHAQGVPVRTVDAAVIRHANKHDQPHQDSVSAYLLADRAEFRKRWDHLGEFRDP